MVKLRKDMSLCPLMFSLINLNEEKRTWGLTKVHWLLIFHRLRVWYTMILKMLSLNIWILSLASCKILRVIQGNILHICTLRLTINYTLIYFYLIGWCLIMIILLNILQILTLLRWMMMNFRSSMEGMCLYILIYLEGIIKSLFKFIWNGRLLKIFKERKPYFYVGSTNEIRWDYDKGRSSRYESYGGILQDMLSFYDTPICFDNIFSLRLECASSFHGHEIEHILDFLDEKKDVEKFCNHSQNVNDGDFEEDQILNHLEEMEKEVSLGHSIIIWWLC